MSISVQAIGAGNIQPQAAKAEVTTFNHQVLRAGSASFATDDLSLTLGVSVGEVVRSSLQNSPDGVRKASARASGQINAHPIVAMQAQAARTPRASSGLIR